MGCDVKSVIRGVNRPMKKLRKWVCAAAALIFGITSVTPAQAAVVNNGAKYEIETNKIPGWPQGPDIFSETAVVIEESTGTVLYDKGMNELRYPASTTKILTTLLALEQKPLTDVVTFTETGIRDVFPGSSNIGMQLGEQLTMEQCLYAIMLKSANEVASQVAEYVGGTEAAFVDQMNQRAQEIGCTNTHFVNASGWHDDNHYTTAYDMALIAREAMRNSEFMKITGTLSYDIPPTNMNSQTRTLSSHQALLFPGDYYYEGCLGGKTGDTDEGGSSLVTYAERNGIRLICVVMKSNGGGESAVDTISLLDYCYNNFEKLQIDAEAVSGGWAMVPKGTAADSLNIEETQQDGQTVKTYRYATAQVGSAVTAPEETAPADVPESEQQESSSLQPDTDSSGEIPITHIVIYVMAGLILLGIIMIIIRLIIRK